MSTFAFEKSTNRKPVLTEKKPAKKQGKVGRPQEQAEPRNKAINCYLTESEYKALDKKLDGRSRSTVMRKLILQYINE
ncbi:MAG: hypothetical protein HWE20_03940 [Gammaproteobacteria bacterium]|nr:hypothetical protein [Gammaproteobacteria bacterium]